MNNIFRIAAALACVILGSCTQDLPEGARAVLDRISDPVFRSADYTATDFGAIADGKTDCRAAINSAITSCSDEGGGRVVLPQGTVFCRGSVVLKSNVNLVIPKGCTLLFSEAPEDYLPAELTVWEGTELYNYSSPIRAWHAENIAITGKGTIDGNAGEGFAKMRPQRSAQQDSLRQMGIDQVPVRERCFGARSILPPNMIEPFGCRNVLIEGITILDSPYWVIHPVFCNNVTVRDVTIDSHNKNNDGCDPEYTSDVLVENCRFRTGDDAIAIKAGRDQDGWKQGRKTSGIVIRNCDFSSRCNGLCIGSEMSAGVEDVYMFDTHVGNCHSAIYFKSNLDRGGAIRNVWVERIVVDTVRTAFIRFENNYHGGRGGNFPTLFENFRISDIKGGKSLECGFYAVGVEGVPISNVSLSNVELKDCPTPYMLKNTRDVVFDRVRINGELLPEKPSETLAAKLKTD
ncbi:MAG: glycoside hydrolase family 28 protein [Candidatus Cryptobacteroides sp.]|nr:glycoside hydrolase family 28 protein [Candidatus Cryptobacteroides sp.]